MQSKKRPNRILIGSCNNQNLTNPLWKVMTDRDPLAFIWAGDAIYAGKLVVNEVFLLLFLTFCHI